MCATCFTVYMFPIGSLILNRLLAFGVILPLLCLGHPLTEMLKAKRTDMRRGKVETEKKKMDRKTQITRREKKKMLGQLRGIF